MGKGARMTNKWQARPKFTHEVEGRVIYEHRQNLLGCNANNLKVHLLELFPQKRNRVTFADTDVYKRIAFMEKNKLQSPKGEKASQSRCWVFFCRIVFCRLLLR